MKRILVALGLTVAVVAYAGNSFKDTLGNRPVTTLDGVTLGNAVGCRCTARIDAGTTTIGTQGFASSGWKIVPWYYDATLAAWVESQSSLHCTPEARLDAGVIRQIVCPDYTPSARFGRLSCAKYGPAGADAGTGADWIADGGVGPQPVFRTECWGPALTGN